MNVENMMSILRDEPIRTWFDLGLFIDRFKENREQMAPHFSGSYDDFLKTLTISLEDLNLIKDKNFNAGKIITFFPLFYRTAHIFNGLCLFGIDIKYNIIDVIT